MMQGLLSKEVLGPSLQDFVEKLPAYLEKNKDTLPKEEVERYENQKKLMEEVLEELNQEKDDDSLEVKKDRFSKVLALMQKVSLLLLYLSVSLTVKLQLQDYGQPPAELVGDVDTPFGFDASGNPSALPTNPDPSANQECSVM